MQGEKLIDSIFFELCCMLFEKLDCEKNAYKNFNIKK